jgi:hypothetical protein
MYLILQLPWSILDFGGMEVRRPVIVTIPRGSNFKWHGEDRLPHGEDRLPLEEEGKKRGEGTSVPRNSVIPARF